MPRAVQQKRKPVGWDGKTLKEMLTESRAQFEESGSYCGVTDLKLKAADPLKYERLYSRLRGMMVASREAALRVSASPIVKELGELCFALYTPEGDSVVLSTGIIVHVHTMSMAIKWMIDNDYEGDPCIDPGDVFGNNDPLIGDAHTADVQSLTAIFYGNEVIGWVGAVTHVMDCGGVDAGGLPIMTINRFGDGLYLSCEKVGVDWKLRRDYEIRCDRNLRYPLFWHLDEKARLAGSQIVHETIGGIIDEFGIDYYKSFIREVIEEGRQIFAKRTTERLFPGVFRSVSYYDVDQKGAPLPLIAAKDSIMHAPVKVEIKPDGQLIFDMAGANRWNYHPANCSISAMQGGFWVSTTQMLAYDGKVNDGAYLATVQHYPYGSWANPDNPHVSNSATWGPLMSTYNNLFRCLSRGFYARGFREEMLAGYGNNTMCQLGGTDQYGRPLGIINFELSAAGCGARAVMDGLDTGYAVWNTEADQGNVEIWEMFIPKVYLGRNLTPDSAGMGKYRGGSGFHSVYLFWNSNNVEVVSAGPGKIFDNCGLFGGYPGARVMRHKEMVLNSNIREVVGKYLPYPTREGDPNNPDIITMLEGDKRILDRSMMHPIPMKTGDVFIQHYQGGPGYGDPIERDAEAVVNDLNNNTAHPAKAREVYGVAAFYDEKAKAWGHDPEKTKGLRDEIRARRFSRAVPTKEWMAQERERVVGGGLSSVVSGMYKESMELSAEFSQQFREFWGLPEDFTF